jgi:hypothetical protein
MTIVYCITAEGADFYEAMTRISIATVRATNPAAYITVACDQHTFHALEASGSPLFTEADSVQGFSTPEGPPVFRNRFVKTRLRANLKGALLFLDSDTIVRGALEPIRDMEADVAAAPNHSLDDTMRQVWEEDLENMRAMGWAFDYPYLNGGVVWYADTQGAHAMEATWHRYWLESVEKTGRYRDQPAFNAAVYASACRLQVLDHRWNAQVQNAPRHARNAVVWHLYINWETDTLYEFKRQLSALKDFRRFSPQQVAKRLLRNNHPWCSRNILDDLVAESMMRTDQMSDAARKWLVLPPGAFALWYARLLVNRWRAWVT